MCNAAGTQFNSYNSFKFKTIVLIQNNDFEKSGDRYRTHRTVVIRTEIIILNSRIFGLVTNTSKQYREGAIYDVVDGNCFKSNPLFKVHTNVLQLILYHDEVEVFNPMGSHIGKYKISWCYYTLANIDPKFRSKLCAIRLLAIVKAKYVAK